MNLYKLRQEYTEKGLSFAQLQTDPTEQFALWFKQAQAAQLLEPNAMSLSTVSPQGMPRLRTVLLKSFDRTGFVFFTNYTSIKARHIASNSAVALHFLWLPLARQVSICGTAERLESDVSAHYFKSRPRASQIGAWCSHQSRVITDDSVLKEKMEQLQQQWQGQEIPVPPFWGGYRVSPLSIEFWQGRPNRLHDRFCYWREQAGAPWKIERLSP